MGSLAGLSTRRFRLVRVLIQTMGNAGDTHPFIGVGETLRKRGHDVVLFGNEVFSDVVERAGLAFVQIGDAETFRRTTEHPDVVHPTKSLRVLFGSMVIPDLRSTISRIEEHLDGTSVLVASTAGFAARMVRELHDAPLVTAHLAPTAFRSYQRLPKSDRMLVSDSSPMWMKRAWWWLGDTIRRPRCWRGIQRRPRRTGPRPCEQDLRPVDPLAGPNPRALP